MVLLQTKLYFSKDPGGSNFFQGGGGGGGVQMFISIETHITCDFPGGGSGPLSPLWIRTWSHLRITLPHYTCKLSILLPWICHNGILCSIVLLLSGILDI